MSRIEFEELKFEYGTICFVKYIGSNSDTNTHLGSIGFFDGAYKFLTSEDEKFFTASDLRTIADKLDELNEVAND